MKSGSMKKKSKLNTVAWLTNVIFLLQRGDLDVDDLFEMTNTHRSEMCESLLYEHPSIRLEDGRVSFRRFADINNQEELLAFLKESFPSGARRIDLRGLYPFVDADLDELIFNGRIVFLDNRQDSLTLPFRCVQLPDSMKSLVLEACNSKGTSS